VSPFKHQLGDLKFLYLKDFKLDVCSLLMEEAVVSSSRESQADLTSVFFIVGTENVSMFKFSRPTHLHEAVATKGDETRMTRKV